VTIFFKKFTYTDQAFLHQAKVAHFQNVTQTSTDWRTRSTRVPTIFKN